MLSLKNKAGFALPLVVVFLLVMSFALAAGLAATAAETGTTTAQRGQNRAYTIAEQALQRFLISRDSLCGDTTTHASCLSDPSAATTGQDSVNLRIAGGKAIVVARLLRP